MVLLENAIHAKKFDTRVIEQNITRGVVALEEYQSILSQLPDDADKFSWVSLDELAVHGVEEDRSVMQGGESHSPVAR